MKTIALFLALLAGAFAQPIPTKSDLGHVETTRTLTFISAAEPQTVTARYLVIVQSAGSEPILRVGELPYERVLNPDAHSFIVSPYRYLRPKKPDEIKVELWTEDGKKWVPKWEESKP